MTKAKTTLVYWILTLSRCAHVQYICMYFAAACMLCICHLAIYIFYVRILFLLHMCHTVDLEGNS